MSIKITVCRDVEDAEGKVKEVSDFDTLEIEIRDGLATSPRCVVPRAQPSPGDPEGEQNAKRRLLTLCWADGRQSNASTIYALQCDDDHDKGPIPGVRGFRFESPRSKPGKRKWKVVHAISRPLTRTEAP